MLAIIEALSDDGQKYKQQVIEVYLRCKNDDIAAQRCCPEKFFDASSTVLDGNLAGYYRLQLCEELVHINLEVLHLQLGDEGLEEREKFGFS